MQVLYDFQHEFEAVEPGEFSHYGPIIARKMGGNATTACVELTDDVKTVRVYNRDAREAGIDIYLPLVGDVQAGDRLTITGRVSEYHSYGKLWCVALLLPQIGQITQFVSPDPLFTLSHILEESETGESFIVHTIGWGSVEPLMDFTIDSVLLLRKRQGSETEEDIRTIVYSLAEDPAIQWIDAGAGNGNVFGNTAFLYRAGGPTINIIKHHDAKAIHIVNRANDYDGVDLNLGRMDLHAGTRYQATVHGRIDGDVPDGTTIMLQGLPGYVWKCVTPAAKDMEFTLTHIFSRSDVEKWATLRITTNAPGATVPFFIYHIKIVRL